MLATASRRQLDALAVLLTAIGVFAAASAWRVWPAACVAMVPLFLRARGGGHMLLLATAALGLASAASWHDVLGALQASFGLGPLARYAVLASLVLWHTLPYALLLALCKHLTTKGVSLCVSAPLLVVPLEAWYPWLFPHHLGLLLVDNQPLLQVAEIGGAAATSSVLLLANSVIAEVVRDRRICPTHWAGIVILAVAASWGALRAAQVDAERADAPVLRVALLSPNYGRLTQERLQLSGSTIVAGMRQAAERARGDGAELVVWPEAVWPHVFDRRLTQELQPGHPWAFRGWRGHHLVVAALTASDDGDGRVRNSVLWFDPDGELRQRHDKRSLIPGFEYGPCDDWFGYGPRFRARFPEWPDVEPGTEPDRPLPDGPLRAGLLCCSEELERTTAFEQVEAGANLLVACSSDAWFQSAHIAAQHEAMARFRAVECRRDYVRAVHAGRSCAIAATGATIALAEYEAPVDQAVHDVPRVVTADVRLLDGRPRAAWTVTAYLWTCVVLGLAAVALPYCRLRLPRTDAAIVCALSASAVPGDR